MEGLSEFVPEPVAIEIDGQTWQVGPLLLADYAAMERQLLGGRQRANAARLDALRDKDDPDRKAILLAAFDEMRRAAGATHEELQAWLNCAEGILIEFWLRVRRGRPGITVDAIRSLFADRTAEISRKIAIAARATGEYPPGNFLCRRRT